MRRSTLIAGAAALDWLVGDPETWPHPVRWIGAACTAGERRLRRAEAGAEYELAAGAGLTCVIVGRSYLLTALVLRAATRLDRALGAVAAVVLASTCLAGRSLADEGAAVLRALDANDLPRARQRLARIVGRDTAALDEHGISRAVIETLAESCCDGIVAPLFFLASGGVPAAMAFKAVSTLDSMIGHRTPEYLYFGRAAARLDDAANWLPARLTGLLIVALASRPAEAMAVYRRDRVRHASPNAGHPEAAMAGALGVELGGPSTYGGEPHDAPRLGAGLPLPVGSDAHRALGLVRRVTLAATLLAIGVALLAERRRRR